MPRRVFLTVAALALACQQTSSGSTTSSDPCGESTTSGWLRFITSHPQAEERLSGAGQGWVALYQRRYLEALEALARSDDPGVTLGVRRAHVLLGRLYRSLAHFTASSLAHYFEQRDALGTDAGRLKKRGFYERVARRLAGLPGRRGRPLRGSYGRLLRAWPKRCPSRWPAKLDVYGVVAHRIQCGAQLPERCPPTAPLRNKKGYRGRVDAYHRALCNKPEEVDVDNIRMLATTPATTENVSRAVAGQTVEAVFDYYDPIALLVLSEYHLRLAQAPPPARDPSAQLVAAWAARERGDKLALNTQLAAGSADEGLAEGFLFSEWASAHDLEKSLRSRDRPPSRTADALIDAFRTLRSRYDAEVSCAKSPAGKQIAQELELARGLAAAEVRRQLLESGDKEACKVSLPVLRATADQTAQDRASWLNEPTFLVRLAKAAQCMGRSSEAIGALNAVEASYPEARAARAAAESLAVVRLMGGSVGTQKTP